MRSLRILPIVALAIVTFGCEKVSTPISPIAASSSTPAAATNAPITTDQKRTNTVPPPSNTTAMSAADEEALKQVKTRFASHYRQQGDLWTTQGFDGLWSTQVKQPSFTIVSSVLSDIDKLNGYEYRGRVIVKFVASRDSHFELGRDQPAGGANQWDDWKAGGQEEIEVLKQKGVWKFRITADPYGNQKDW